MPSTTNNLPGTAEDSGFGSGLSVWANVNNIKAVGGGTADAAVNGDDSADYLIARNFGFSIPSDQVITGVIVEASGYSDWFFDGNPNDGQTSAYLWYNGLVYYTQTLITDAPKASILMGPDTAGLVQTDGTSSNIWSAHLTPAIINDPQFGVAFTIGVGNADTLPVNFSMDYVKMQVFYQASGAGNRSMLLGVW